MVVRPIGVALALLLCGCATGQTASLPPLRTSLLADPSANSLAVQTDAAAIERPWLQPVPVDLARPLDANAVSLIAIAANPDLRALRTRANVADAQVYAAGLLPDPSINVGIDLVASGPMTAIANALAASLSLDFAAIRTRSATLAQADASARQVHLDLAWAEWTTAGQARLLASQIVATDQQLGLLREAASLTADLSARTLRAAGRGDVTGDQLQSARLAQLDAEAQLRSSELTVTDLRANLNRLLGLPPLARLDLAVPDEPSLSSNCSFIFRAAMDRPDLLALRAGYASQDAALRLALLSGFPAPGLSINGSRNESGNIFLGPAISLSLPVWNRGRGSIAVAEATGDALQAEYDARLFATRADIFALCEARRVASGHLAIAVAQLPELERFAAATARAAARGDLARSVSDNARLSFLAKQLLVMQLSQNQLERAIGLEVASGHLAQTLNNEGDAHDGE